MTARFLPECCAPALPWSLMACASIAQAAPAHDVLAPAGIQAARIVGLWHFTLIVCAVVFAAILIALFIALKRAPRANPQSLPDISGLDRPENGPRKAVAIATALSVLGLVGLIAADVLTDRSLSRLPVADPVKIDVIGHQWWWEMRYHEDGGEAGFVTANVLHIPVGRPVIVSLKSADVIHTFWVPNLHGKKDMIPGRDATIEFRADKPGEYGGQCAEFCGAEHALMAFSVVAGTPAQYDAWRAQQRRQAPPPDQPEQQIGQRVFMANACAQCHTIRGAGAAGAIGPDLTHLASRPTLAAGAALNNRANLATWVTSPGTLKPATLMPPTALSPPDLQALLSYLETLQ